MDLERLYISRAYILQTANPDLISAIYGPRVHMEYSMKAESQVKSDIPQNKQMQNICIDFIVIK